MKRRATSLAAAILVIATLLTGCQKTSEVETQTKKPQGSSSIGLPFFTSSDANSSSEAPTGSTSPDTSGTPVVTTPKTQSPSTLPHTTAPTDPSRIEVDLLAAGDNLFHGPLCEAGDALGYDRLYDGIREVVTAADIALLNQETAFTYGAWASYPRFATPTAVGDAAIAAGFDVFSCATNHTWDLGMAGVEASIKYWSEHPEVTELGLNPTINDRNKLDIVEVNGMKLAMFSFGTLINTKADKWWMANYLDKSEGTREWIAGQIRKAKAAADFVIVCAHWGDEYVYTPTDSEVYWANFFTECEVDLVIGTHPHVVQPVMELTSESGHKTVVYYSLGNFLHNQNDLNTNVGAIAKVKLVKDKNGARIETYEMLPTTVDCQVIDGVRSFTPRLLSDMTDDMLKTSFKWGSSGKKVSDFQAIFDEASTSYPGT